MHTKLRLLPLLAVVAILFSSCHRVAKHARYIPKDAFAVVGIHTDQIKKELAWSAITGSNLLDELRKSGFNDRAPAAIKDLENAGIDYGSTLYFYAKPDTRYAEGMKLAAVFPLTDGAKLKAWFSKHFPGLPVRDAGGRSEVLMDGKICISWNDEVAMAMNGIVRKLEHKEPARTDTVGDIPVEGQAYNWTENFPDSAATLAEMAAAFQPAKGSGIDENSRFVAMEKAEHDITLFMSYDAMMDMYNSRDLGGIGMMSTTMGTTMFKGSAMASGFDFEKGRIDGLMRYYASDSMKPVAKEFARENVDGDMLRRLPAPGLNMAAGYHLSPAAIKLMLEKMNLSGMANLALMSQGLSMDDVLGAFTGDMVMAINNSRLEQHAEEIADSIREQYGITPYPVTKPALDFVFAMKIGDKAKLNKLLALFGRSGMMQQTAPNTYSLPGQQGGSFVIGDKYIAASTNTASAQAFLKEHAGAMPDAVHKEISGHPVGMWADIQSFVKGSASIAGGSPSDSTAFTIVRNAFTTFALHGGEYKDDANEYRMSVGFVNKDENSLVQLLYLAQQLAAVNGRKDAITVR